MAKDKYFDSSDPMSIEHHHCYDKIREWLRQPSKPLYEYVGSDNPNTIVELMEIEEIYQESYKITGVWVNIPLFVQIQSMKSRLDAIEKAMACDNRR